MSQTMQPIGVQCALLLHLLIPMQRNAAEAWWLALSRTDIIANNDAAAAPLQK
jgi:hypothetical protein